MEHRPTMSDVVSLRLTDHAVADYVWQPRLPLSVSPRPFLHPVRTLAGTEVTELMPADHPHHLGVGVAIADVGGVNFWGGRTFVPGRGPTDLRNHGTQHHQNLGTHSFSSLDHDLRWTGPDGVDLLHERRSISAVAVDDVAWALDFSYELTNMTALPLAFASPATNGRPGAGYGGFFWRARRDGQRVEVLGPDRAGVRHLHGSRARWLALAGGDSDAPWSLVFVPDQQAQGIDPWFVRHDDYAGVGSSLAWDRPLVVAQGAGIRRRIVTLVVDGRLRSAQVAGILDAAEAILREPDRGASDG